MKRYIILGLLSSSLFLVNGCAVNPVTGKKQIVLMSEAQEVAMGKEADPQIIAQYGLYEDKNLQDFITQKGNAMAAISHRPNLKYEFKIVDSDVINAFAVPGGYVYFTRGIMAHFNNEAEFAGVLGHEIGHITARHTVAQQAKSVLSQVGLIGSMILVPQLGEFAQPLSQGLGVLFLKFGRDAERQSDDLGVEYSSKIGYDAHEMAGFFNTLERKSAGSGNAELPDFLSTHPNPADRNVAVNNLSVEWKKKLNLTNPQINRDSYLKKIDGIIYGEDPKGGYLEDNIFYHPVLKFQFAVPQNWNYENSPQRVQMAPKDGKALMMMTLSPGKSLDEAANGVVQQNNLQVLESNKVSVNGLNALYLIADVKPQQQGQASNARTMVYLIEFGGNIYMILGASSPQDFNNYAQSFSQSMKSFRQLTDMQKINKLADRVRIKTVRQTGTLQQALINYKVPQKKLEEVSILNGMNLNDRVTQGSLIKVIDQ